jgi:hypothetical protein
MRRPQSATAKNATTGSDALIMIEAARAATNARTNDLLKSIKAG